MSVLFCQPDTFRPNFRRLRKRNRAVISLDFNRRVFVFPRRPSPTAAQPSPCGPAPFGRVPSETLFVPADRNWKLEGTATMGDSLPFQKSVSPHSPSADAPRDCTRSTAHQTGFPLP